MLVLILSTPAIFSLKRLVTDAQHNNTAPPIYGIGLQAHPQNTMVLFFRDCDGKARSLLIRDFGDGNRATRLCVTTSGTAWHSADGFHRGYRTGAHVRAAPRTQAGLNPSSAKEKARRSTVYTLLELNVRQKTGGPAFRFEYRSCSISPLTARLEAEKAVRQQGLEVWAVLDIQQVTE